MGTDAGHGVAGEQSNPRGLDRQRNEGRHRRARAVSGRDMRGLVLFLIFPKAASTPPPRFIRPSRTPVLTPCKRHRLAGSNPNSTLAHCSVAALIQSMTARNAVSLLSLVQWASNTAIGRCKDLRVPRPIVIAIAVIMVSLNALVLWELGVKATAAHATSGHWFCRFAARPQGRVHRHRSFELPIAVKGGTSSLRRLCWL